MGGCIDPGGLLSRQGEPRVWCGCWICQGALLTGFRIFMKWKPFNWKKPGVGFREGGRLLWQRSAHVVVVAGEGSTPPDTTNPLPCHGHAQPWVSPESKAYMACRPFLIMSWLLCSTHVDRHPHGTLCSILAFQDAVPKLCPRDRWPCICL